MDAKRVKELLSRTLQDARAVLNVTAREHDCCSLECRQDTADIEFYVKRMYSILSALHAGIVSDSVGTTSDGQA